VQQATFDASSSKICMCIIECVYSIKFSYATQLRLFFNPFFKRCKVVSCSFPRVRTVNIFKQASIIKRINSTIVQSNPKLAACLIFLIKQLFKCLAVCCSNFKDGFSRNSMLLVHHFFCRPYALVVNIPHVERYRSKQDL